MRFPGWEGRRQEGMVALTGGCIRSRLHREHVGAVTRLWKKVQE